MRRSVQGVGAAFLTYNVWFDDSVAVHGRMAAIADIVSKRAPVVVGLQGWCQWGPGQLHWQLQWCNDPTPRPAPPPPLLLGFVCVGWGADEKPTRCGFPWARVPRVVPLVRVCDPQRHKSGHHQT